MAKDRSYRVFQNKDEFIFDFINYMFLGIVFLVVVYPLIYVLSASVSNPHFVMKGEVWFLPKGFCFDAYAKVFANKSIISGYKNTTYYVIVGTSINLIMTFLAAYPLSRKDLKGRNLFMGFFVFTMFFSGGLIPTYLVVRSLGLLNTFWVMVIPNAVAVWNIIITRTFFTNTIPYELQESALIDGCNNIRILVSIIVPLSAPIIAVNCLFYAVGHWNSYFNALLYLSDKSRHPLQLIMRELLIQVADKSTVSPGSTIEEQVLMAEGIKYALIVIASFPLLILYPFIQRYFVRGIMVGALKG